MYCITLLFFTFSLDFYCLLKIGPIAHILQRTVVHKLSPSLCMQDVGVCASVAVHIYMDQACSFNIILILKL